MAEPIEMPFGKLTRVEPRNRLLGGGRYLPREGAILLVVWPVKTR